MALTISGFNMTGNLTAVHIPPPPLAYYLWSSGLNTKGQLGLGNTTAYSSPKQIGSLSTWSTITSGYKQSHAIQIDGTLWAWGNNYYGIAGLGTDSIANSSPIQVGALTNWLKVSSNYSVVHAIKTDGTLWSWGRGQYGRHGLGDTISRSSPVQVGSATNWANVEQGVNNSAAIKTNGTLWTWGYNGTGTLGLSNTTYYSNPVQVGALTNWVSVVVYTGHMGGVKSDGTLWTWGRNNHGQLGLGDTTNRSSPVQVGVLTNWLNLSGGQYNVVATKTDGTLWSWGRNAYGQLGLGDTTNRSSPVQVGALTNWNTLAEGNFTSHSGAIKTNGTLWLWGLNSTGQLSLGDTTDRSSPVQVGALTSWTKVSLGADHTIAIG